MKIPRFAFEKFPIAEGGLTTQMKSVGEVMAIGRTFKQAFMKAMRSRELDADRRGRRTTTRSCSTASSCPPTTATSCCSRRCGAGVGVEELHRRTAIHPWFLDQFEELVAAESGRRGRARAQEGPRLLRRAGRRRRAPSGSRRACGPSFKSVDTCAAEFEAETPYFYSSYERAVEGGDARGAEVRRGSQPSVVILGSGPNRIGQGIEFDYCCVHAAMTVRELGRDAVMVNCNPETVSTDYDTSDRLYFEPLTVEDVLEVVDVEQPGGRDRAVRRPDAAADRGEPAGGRRAAARHAGRRRSTWPRTAAASARCSTELGIQRPPYGVAHDAAGGARGRAPGRLPAAGAPLLRARRPRDGDLLLGGGPRGYLERLEADGERGREQMYPLLLDRFLENAIELDVDALADGEDVYVAGIMQHVEEAGVHSGDSACVLPPLSLGERHAGGDPPPDARASRCGWASSGC